MYKSLKVFLLINIAFWSLESHSMLNKHSLLKPCKRWTSTQLFAPANTARVQASCMILSYTQQNKHSKNSFNFKKFVPYAAGIAGGFALGYLGLKNNQDEDRAIKKLAAAKQKLKKTGEELLVYNSPWHKQRENFRERLLSTSWNDVSREFIDALDEQSQKLDEEFFKLAAITADMYAVFKITFDNLQIIEKREKQDAIKCSLPPEFYANRIKGWLQTMMFDASDLTILKSEDMQSPMAACRRQLYINPKFFKDFKNITQFDASLIHELAHILQDDASTLMVQLILLDIGCKDKSLAHAYFNKRRLFAEKRADILAGLVHPDFALALSELMHGLANPVWQEKVLAFAATGKRVNFDNSGREHPKHSERSIYMKELHEKMLAAVEKNKQKV